jgi:hypothetical protein
MPSPTVNISLTTSAPGTTDIVQPGKVTFTNNTGVSISLTLPTCVSPGGGTIVSLANGITSSDYNVNNNQNGDYNYSYTGAWTEGDTLSGTIDVS